MNKEPNILQILIAKGLFDPRRVTARRMLNEQIVQAWFHAEKYGDVTKLRKLIGSFPERTDRLVLSKELLRQLPLKQSSRELSNLTLDRDRQKNWRQPDTWPDFALSLTSIAVEADVLEIGGIALTTRELFSLLVDHLVLQRDEIPHTDIDEMIALLQRIKDRQNKNCLIQTEE